MNIEKILSLGQSIEANKQHILDYQLTYAEKAAHVGKRAAPAFLALCAVGSVYFCGLGVGGALSMGVSSIAAYLSFSFVSKGVKSGILHKTFQQTVADIEKLKTQYVVMSAHLLHLKEKQEVSNTIARQIYQLEDFICPKDSWMGMDLESKMRELKMVAEEKIFSLCAPEKTSYLMSEGNIDLGEVERYMKTAFYHQEFMANLSDQGLSGVLSAMNRLAKAKQESAQERHKKVDDLMPLLDKDTAIKMLELYKKYRSESSYNKLLAHTINHFGNTEQSDDKEYSFIYKNIDKLSAEDKTEFTNIVESILPQLREISKNSMLLKDTSITDNIERTRQQIDAKIQGFISIIEADIQKDTRILKKMTASN